jgi:hypothetical protein
MSPDLNMKLQQSGFETLGDLVKVFVNGAITNEHLVDALAQNLSRRIVNNLSAFTTSRVQSGNPELSFVSPKTLKIECGRRDLNTACWVQIHLGC